MRLYRDVEVAEYWLVDWRKRQVEIYILSPDESSVDHAEYRLIRTITEENKRNCSCICFRQSGLILNSFLLIWIDERVHEN